MDNPLRSPRTGKTLRKVATRTLTPMTDVGEKVVTVNREFIEVIIGDTRLPGSGEQWGHAAIMIDGTVYLRAHDEYLVMSKTVYMNGGKLEKALKILSIRGQSYRDSVGLVLWLSAKEKQMLDVELKRRVALDRQLILQSNGTRSSYSVLDNSCSTNVADVLELIGILAHDPRWPPTPVTPAELLAALEKSRRLVRKNFYPRKPS